MSDLFNAIRVDLLDRRRRPVLILVVAALVGALAYAVLAKGSSTASAPALGPEPTLATSGVRVTQGQPNADQAVAETTSGASHQHAGGSRDPFTPLPGAIAEPQKSSSSSSSSGSSGVSGSSGSSGSSRTGASGSPSAGKAPARHVTVKTTYRVAVLFGAAPPGTPAAEANLKPYESLKQNQLIPSKAQPLVAFRGVVANPDGSHSVAFTLVGEAIPHGPGICRPSPVACQTLDLEVGQTEEFEVTTPSGEKVNYELQPASIVFVTKASAASKHSVDAGASPAGLALLRRLGLLALPGLRYSSSDGLLRPRAQTAASATG